MTFAFAGYYFDNIVSSNGGPLPHLQLTVYLHGTLTQATLYTDRTKITTAPNPTSTDALSNLAFYATPGQYDLVTASGYTLTVSVVPDSADIGGGGGGAVSSVFGRTGAVTAQSGDYSAGQVTGAALDNAVVHLAGIETILGAKTFNALLTAIASAIITAEDPLTITFTRATFAGAGSNLWECRVQGQLTGYANEGGELRSRAYNGVRVAFRTQSNVAGDNTTVHILEATWSDNTPMFWVNAVGDASLVRDMVIGRDLAITRNLAVTGTISGNLGVLTQLNPSDHATVAWNFPPYTIATQQVLNVSGTMQLMRVPIASSSLITNIVMNLAALGTSLTAGQSFCALYTGAGNLLAVTADQAANWAGTTGLKTMALASPQTVTSDCFVGVWSVSAGTLPAFSMGLNGQAGLMNFGTSGFTTICGTGANGTGLTTTAPATTGALTAGNRPYWVALT